MEKRERERMTGGYAEGKEGRGLWARARPSAKIVSENRKPTENLESKKSGYNFE